MELLAQLTPAAARLLCHLPLPQIHRRVAQSPSSGMVYTDRGKQPRTCILRTGALLFLGGEPSSACLSFLKDRLLTQEICEKYETFYLFYSGDAWLHTLTTLFPGRISPLPALPQAALPPFLSEAMGSIRPAPQYGPVLLLDLHNQSRVARAPEESLVRKIVTPFFPGITSVHRVPQGASTYVYRIKGRDKTCYARFLPEDASFAPEVFVHRLAAEKNVPVPRVLAFQSKEAKTGLSFMLLESLPGNSLADAHPPEEVMAGILRQAGQALARLHTIPVDGFGWVDRSFPEYPGAPALLKGQFPTFQTYFSDYLSNDLQTLRYYPFSTEELLAYQDYMAEAGKLLVMPKAVLVHGDFDFSHIFHQKGRFQGFLDFGEIRGNHPFFDLATFACSDNSPGRSAYRSLLEGYCQVTPFAPEDCYLVELMALFFLLRFLGKKVEHPAGEYFFSRAKQQLNYMKHTASR